MPPSLPEPRLVRLPLLCSPCHPGHSFLLQRELPCGLSPAWARTCLARSLCSPPLPGPGDRAGCPQTVPAVPPESSRTHLPRRCNRKLSPSLWLAGGLTTSLTGLCPPHGQHPVSPRHPPPRQGPCAAGEGPRPTSRSLSPTRTPARAAGPSSDTREMNTPCRTSRGRAETGWRPQRGPTPPVPSGGTAGQGWKPHAKLAKMPESEGQPQALCSHGKSHTSGS